VCRARACVCVARCRVVAGRRLVVEASVWGAGARVSVG